MLGGPAITALPEVEAGGSFLARLALGVGGRAVIAADCEGKASIGGVSVAAKSGRDVCLVRLDTDGKPLSTGLYDGPSDVGLQALALTPQGGAVIVGVSIGAPPAQGFVALIP